jgi:hypothetical protein
MPQDIIKSRLEGLAIFDPTAIELCARYAINIYICARYVM